MGLACSCLAGRWPARLVTDTDLIRKHHQIFGWTLLNQLEMHEANPGPYFLLWSCNLMNSCPFFMLCLHLVERLFYFPPSFAFLRGKIFICLSLFPFIGKGIGWLFGKFTLLLFIDTQKRLSCNIYWTLCLFFLFREKKQYTLVS